jgi:hypothetical protein
MFVLATAARGGIGPEIATGAVVRGLRIGGLSRKPIGASAKLGRSGAGAWRRAFVSGSSLVDSQRSTVKRLSIESTDCFLGLSFIRKFNESESAGTASFAVLGNMDERKSSYFCEMLTKLVFCCVIGDISNK